MNGSSLVVDPLSNTTSTPPIVVSGCVVLGGTLDVNLNHSFPIGKAHSFRSHHERYEQWVYSGEERVIASFGCVSGNFSKVTSLHASSSLSLKLSYSHFHRSMRSIRRLARFRMWTFRAAGPWSSFRWPTLHATRRALLPPYMSLWAPFFSCCHYYASS